MDDEYRAEAADGWWRFLRSDGSPATIAPIGVNGRDAKIIAAALNDAFAAGQQRRSEELMKLLRNQL